MGSQDTALADQSPEQNGDTAGRPSYLTSESGAEEQALAFSEAPSSPVTSV